MQYLADAPDNLDTEALKESRQHLIRVKAVLHGFTSSEAQTKRNEITEVIQAINQALARRGIEVGGGGQLPDEQADALDAEEHVKQDAPGVATCAPGRS